MTWYPTLVFYFGLFDAGLIMLGGLIVAVFILIGKEVGPIMERIGPALGTIIGSNIAAALILGATRWLIG
mgnify:CR=1 FL=1